MNLGQIRSARSRDTLLPPEVDSGTVLHPIRADQSTISGPLTRDAVFEPVPVGRGRQQPARKIQAILPTVTSAAANAVVKLELAVRVEDSAADNRAANGELHALW